MHITPIAISHRYTPYVRGLYNMQQSNHLLIFDYILFEVNGGLYGSMGSKDGAANLHDYKYKLKRSRRLVYNTVLKIAVFMNN